MSFHETVQRATETVRKDQDITALLTKYVVAVIESPKRPDKTIVSLVHVLVHVLRFGSYSTGVALLNFQDCFLPSVFIEATDSACIGRAILRNLETNMFGTDVRSWLSRVGFLVMICIFISADAASANSVAIRCPLVLLTLATRSIVVVHHE